MRSQASRDKNDDVDDMIIRRGHDACWEKYHDKMPESTRQLYESLVDIPTDMIVRCQPWFFFSKRVAPVAGGGFHMRLARKLSMAARLAHIEVFSPKKAAEGKMDGFRPLDVPILLGSAEQGDIVFFRARAKADLLAVANFFATSSVLTERSKGDD